MPACPNCKRPIAATRLREYATRRQEVVCSTCGERLLMQSSPKTQLKLFAVTFTITALWVGFGFPPYLLLALVAWFIALPLLKYHVIALVRNNQSSSNTRVTRDAPSAS